MGQIVEPPFDPMDSRQIPTIPQAYYLLGAFRIVVDAHRRRWCRTLEGLGAVRVTREEYDRADSLEIRHVR